MTVKKAYSLAMIEAWPVAGTWARRSLRSRSLTVHKQVIEEVMGKVSSDTHNWTHTAVSMGSWGRFYLVFLQPFDVFFWFWLLLYYFFSYFFSTFSLTLLLFLFFYFLCLCHLFFFSSAIHIECFNVYAKEIKDFAVT